MNTPAAPPWFDDPKLATAHPGVMVRVPYVPYSPEIIAVPWPERAQGNSPASWLITHSVAGRIPLLCADLRSAHDAMASLDISIAKGGVTPDDPETVRGWCDWYLANRPPDIKVYGLREYQ